MLSELLLPMRNDNCFFFLFALQRVLFFEEGESASLGDLEKQDSCSNDTLDCAHYQHQLFNEFITPKPT